MTNVFIRKQDILLSACAADYALSAQISVAFGDMTGRVLIVRSCYLRVDEHNSASSTCHVRNSNVHRCVSSYLLPFSVCTPKVIQNLHAFIIHYIIVYSIIYNLFIYIFHRERTAESLCKSSFNKFLHVLK